MLKWSKRSLCLPNIGIGSGRETELCVILSLHTKISSDIQQSGIIEPLSVPDRHLTAKDW